MRARHQLVLALSLLPLACGDDRGADSAGFSESETAGNEAEAEAEAEEAEARRVEAVKAGK